MPSTANSYPEERPSGRAPEDAEQAAQPFPGNLAKAICAGDRRALARAVTLIESARSDHREEAERLIAAISPHTGGATRLGITGPPGAGKSTFIERFGLDGVKRGHRIAVLAVDPASKRGGGAILGDKTRMAELARSPDAFIRPSPGSAAMGGVARRTRETILLCEAAGFDTVIVETIGAGQSETTVAEMVDMFLLILPPAAGDELQGLKRGIIELADLVLVNKADGELLDHANRSVADYANALRLVPPARRGWDVPVRAISALTGTGVDAIWDDVARFRAVLEPSGEWSLHRAAQARAALLTEIGEGLLAKFHGVRHVAARFPEIEREVMSGGRTPAEGARELLRLFIADA